MCSLATLSSQFWEVETAGVLYGCPTFGEDNLTHQVIPQVSKISNGCVIPSLGY